MAKKGRGKKAEAKRPVGTGTTSVAALRRALTGESTEVSPVEALTRLHSIGAPRLSGVLVDLATSAEDTSLRAAAVAALGDRTTKRHRETLVQALDDPAHEVVRRAAEGLGRVGGETELGRLRALRPRDPVVKRAVDTAKTLIGYRTGGTRGRLSVPGDGESLVLGRARSTAIEVRAVSDADLDRLEADLERELSGMPTARSAHTIGCGRAHYLLVLARALERRKDFAWLGKRSSLAGVLLRRDEIDSRYYQDAYVLTHPGPGKAVRVFVMRGSGRVTHYGTLTPGGQGASFSIGALNTRQTRPLTLEGSVEQGSLAITVEKGAVATEKSAVQPRPNRPRGIRTTAT